MHALTPAMVHELAVLVSASAVVVRAICPKGIKR